MEKLKKGVIVRGTLLQSSKSDVCKVLRDGYWRDVQKYDTSGAMREALELGVVKNSSRVIAVELPDGETGVYLRSEVWKDRG